MGLPGDFDRMLKLALHGGRITSGDGLPTGRELGHALGLGDLSGVWIGRVSAQPRQSIAVLELNSSACNGHFAFPC